MKRRKKVIWIILTCTVLVIVGLVCRYIWNKNHTISLRDDFAARQSIKGEFAVFVSGINNVKLSAENTDN